MVIEKNVYQRNGFKNRKEYLQDLADEFGLPEDLVFMSADMLGESEDFDGLINILEDAEEFGF
jgi:hypothetical protein